VTPAHAPLRHDYRKTISEAVGQCFTLVGAPDIETFIDLVTKIQSLVEGAARTTMHPDLLASGGMDIKMYRESMRQDAQGLTDREET